MMKSKRLILCLLGLCGWFVAVQAQTVALKTDLVNWATASLNLEPEVKVGRKSTMALGLSWNPWTFSDNKKWRHLRVQPEYRYWICRPFGGHFLGLHASYTRFNAGGAVSYTHLDVYKRQMTDGVNYTAGLPIVRTSPDHGTAYDIAGQGKADEASFRQAVYAALDVYRNRVRYEEAYAHPLRKQYHERRDDSDKLKLNAPEE